MAAKKRFPYRSALVACNGGCRAVQGEEGCTDGCIGCGACVSVCKFGAISLNEYGVAEVDEDKCLACGKCMKVCPQEIIHIHECANYIVVKCSNKSKGAEAKKQCEVSCIGCGICEKICTAGAVRIMDKSCSDPGKYVFKLWHVFSEMPASCNFMICVEYLQRQSDRIPVDKIL